MEKSSKRQVQEKIEDFFSNIKSKDKEQVRKIKKLAMHYKIRLKEKRKLFCKFCYSPRLKVLGIKNKMKRVRCEECGRLMRWKIKSIDEWGEDFKLKNI